MCTFVYCSVACRCSLCIRGGDISTPRRVSTKTQPTYGISKYNSYKIYTVHMDQGHRGGQTVDRDELISDNLNFDPYNC